MKFKEVLSDFLNKARGYFYAEKGYFNIGISNILSISVPFSLLFINNILLNKIHLPIYLKCSSITKTKTEVKLK